MRRAKLRVLWQLLSSGYIGVLEALIIRPCHTAAILSRETKKALFYHAKPRPHAFDREAWRGRTKLFWSPGTIWPPCDKGEWLYSNFNLITLFGSWNDDICTLEALQN